MSIWTHCSGAMCIIGTDSALQEVDCLIGKEIHFDSSIEEWNYAVKHRDEYMPFGSEGSVHLRKTRKRKPVYSEYADEQHYKKYYVFEGNLRDYADDEGLMHWFTELLYSIQKYPLNCVVCDARFETECMQGITLTYRTQQDVYTDTKQL